jgi:hypothetical protein
VRGAQISLGRRGVIASVGVALVSIVLLLLTADAAYLFVQVHTTLLGTHQAPIIWCHDLCFANPAAPRGPNHAVAFLKLSLWSGMGGTVLAIGLLSVRKFAVQRATRVEIAAWETGRSRRSSSARGEGLSLS